MSYTLMVSKPVAEENNTPTEVSFVSLGGSRQLANGGEYGTNLAVFLDSPRGLRGVIAGLGLTAESSFKRQSNYKRRRYVGSGLWNMYKNLVNTVIIDIAVGCYCDRDCCGHLCSLRFHISRHDDLWIVTKAWARNY